MKRIILALSLALLASMAQAQYVDDMYDMAPAKPKKEKTSKADNSYTYKAAEKSTPKGEAVSTNTTSDNKELITSFEEALQRRLNALRNSYEMDDAYWQLMQQYQAILEAKYDKHLYNIVVVANDMWVEPQAITAMFDGSDPAEGVVQYNEQIKKRIAGEKPAASTTQSSSNGGSDNQTINIYLTVDPWSYSSWNYGWDRPYYGYGYPYGYGYGYGYGGYWGSPYYGYGYGGGWYNPWYNPYYYGHNHGHYSPAYYGNPRGTYYGNSASGYSRNQGGTGGMGGARQPRINGESGGRGTSRDQIANLRPTGSNTVSGLTGRGGRGELRGRGDIPTGGVADMRNAGNSFDGGSTTRVRTNREGAISRPTVQNYNPSTTFDRTNNNYDRRERNTYERPVERPTTYERPAERPTTYERPSSFDRGGGSTSRPSSGGGGGGGGMGGGRPTGGRGR